MGQVSFFIIFISALSLGQLQRISLDGNISFYIHELLVWGWLIFTFFTKKKELITGWKRLKAAALASKIDLVLLGTLGAIVITGWLNAARLGLLTITPFLYLGRYTTYIIFFTLVWWTQPLEKKWWPRLIILLNFMWLFFGLGQFFLYPDSRDLMHLGWDNHYYRLVGTIFDPAFIGLLLVWFWLWLIGERWIKKWQRMITVLMMTLASGAIFLTYSRAAYLAWGGGIVCWLFIEFRQKNRPKKNKTQLKKWWYIIVGLIGMGIVFWWLPKPAGDSTNLLRTNSIMIRIEEARRYFQAIQVSQVFLGKGLFLTTPYSAYWIPYQGAEVKLTAAFPDNLLVMLFSFGGVLGMTIVFYYLVKITKIINLKMMPLLPLWIAWLINAQFNNSAFQAFVWMSFGLYLMANLHKSKTKQAKKYTEQSQNGAC